MKKIVLLLSLAILFACKKNNKDEPLPEQKLKYVRVKDAVLLLNVPSIDKTGKSSNVFSKVTDVGSIKPIYFIGDLGDTININSYVKAVNNINSHFILLSGDFPTNIVGSKNILVNKITEEVYKFPDIEINNRTFDADYRSGLTDFQRDLIEEVYYHQNSMIYKLSLSNLNNITVQEYIPKQQQFDKFLIDPFGNCLYGEYLSSNNFKLKLTSGKIISLTSTWLESKLGAPFFNLYTTWLGFDGNFYFLGSMSGKNTIVKLSIANNEVSALKTAEIINPFPLIPNDNGYRFVKNPVRGSIAFPGQKGVMEYIESTKQVNSYTNTYNFFINKLMIGSSQKYFYISTGDDILKYSMQNYSVAPIFSGKNNYEIYSLSMDENNDVVFFTGLSFADGKNVAGKISEQNGIEVIADNSTNKITVLQKIR